MFSGIVEAVGTVADLAPHGSGGVLTVRGGLDPHSLVIGESILTNGVCLTVRTITPEGFVADLSAETLQRTTLGALSPGRSVNLERSLRLGDRIGGHFVFGHVDTLGRIASIEPEPPGALLQLTHPPDFARYVVDKGSIAVDGISLTVCRPKSGCFSIALVPHTLQATTLGTMRAGDAVNLEADMLARYAQRAVEADTA